jgi:hypothetical protein
MDGRGTRSCTSRLRFSKRPLVHKGLSSQWMERMRYGKDLCSNIATVCNARFSPMLLPSASCAQ